MKPGMYLRPGRSQVPVFPTQNMKREVYLQRFCFSACKNRNAEAAAVDLLAVDVPEAILPAANI